MPRSHPPREGRRLARFAWLALIPLVWPAQPAGAGAGEAAEVTFRPGPGRVRIEVGGRPLASYVYRDEEITRPYFCDVHAPDGTQVTRNHPPVKDMDPTDHATMHPGIWLAFGDLDGADNWRNEAKVEHERFLADPAGGPGGGSFTVSNRYRAEDGSTICRETCRYDFLVRPSGYLLIATSEFASGDDFAFGDQEEMGFGVRIATPLSGKKGGRILNSEGQSGEREVWGQAADWCDYSGTIDGHQVGFTLMPDPRNFRRSWYHARDYGLLVANPFGRKAMEQGEESREVVKRGEPFRLGFGILLHASPSGEAVDLKAAYQDYRDQLERSDEGAERSSR